MRVVLKKMLIGMVIGGVSFLSAHRSIKKANESFLNYVCISMERPYPFGIQRALDTYGIQDGSNLSIKMTEHPVFLMRFCGTPAYYAFSDTIVFPSTMQSNTENLNTFSVAHELAHRKYNHVQLEEACSWMTFVGSFIYAGSRIKNSCVPVLRKIPGVRRVPFLVGLLCLQKLANLQLSRYCEKHADLVAAQKVGIEGGIEWINMITNNKNNVYKMILEEVEQEGYSKKMVEQLLKIDSMQLFQKHPLDEKRIAYLKEYQKTGKIPFIYRLPDLLPFWPKKND